MERGEQLKALRAKMDALAPDCGDNSCHFATKRGGMRTNGGCRCLSTRSFMSAPAIEQYAFVAKAYLREQDKEK